MGLISQLPPLRIGMPGIRGREHFMENCCIASFRKNEKNTSYFKLRRNQFYRAVNQADSWKVCFTGRRSAVCVCFARQVWSDKHFKSFKSKQERVARNPHSSGILLQQREHLILRVLNNSAGLRSWVLWSCQRWTSPSTWLLPLMCHIYLSLLVWHQCADWCWVQR